MSTDSAEMDSVEADPMKADSAETASVDVENTEEISFKGFNPGDAKLRYETTEPMDRIPEGSNYCRIIQYKWGDISFAIHEKSQYISLKAFS